MRWIPLLLLLGGMAQEESFDQKVDAFASKIAAGQGDNLAAFQEAIGTPAGRIVLRDRTEKAADGLRRRAERNALPAYFEAHFEKVEKKYRLREGQDQFRRRIVDGYKIYAADVASLKPLIQKVVENLADDEEGPNAILRTYL